MTTSTDQRIGQLWRAARAPVLIGMLVLLAATVLGVVAGQTGRGLLDPRAVDGPGSRAVVELLREQGVDVELTRTAQRGLGTGTTVLVAFPQRLTRGQLEEVRDSTADLVLVAPGANALRVLAPRVEVAGGAVVELRPPGCALPAARAAGPADLGGETYRVRVRAQRCYPAAGDPSLVQLADGPRTVTVLGAPAPLTNDALPEHGNAALALRLLGARPQLVWYLPGVAPPAPDGQRSLLELLPDGVLWGTAQLGVAALLVAAWRARRLGPVVAEPLPVIVRAAETVEGQARLYRRSGARGHAADVLREAVRSRLRPLLGVPPAAEPVALVAAVAGRTGQSGPDVSALLYGAAPGDDAALVRLADDLDALEGEVRRS